MLPRLYGRWLDGLLKGEEEAPISSIEFERLGSAKRLEYISGLGFSEHLTESTKESLFEDDDFDRAIYHVIDGSDEIGKAKAVNVISTAAENILSEAELMKRLAKKALPKLTDEKTNDIEEEIIG